jgi:hypothetical protein
MFSKATPRRGTIKYCDSEYHILETNVNIQLRAYGGNWPAPGWNGLSLSTVLPAEPRAVKTDSLSAGLGFRLACGLVGDQDDPTGDLTTPQLI